MSMQRFSAGVIDGRNGNAFRVLIERGGSYKSLGSGWLLSRYIPPRDAGPRRPSPPGSGPPTPPPPCGSGGGCSLCPLWWGWARRSGAVNRPCGHVPWSQPTMLQGLGTRFGMGQPSRGGAPWLASGDWSPQVGRTAPAVEALSWTRLLTAALSVPLGPSGWRGPNKGVPLEY